MPIAGAPPEVSAPKDTSSLPVSRATAASSRWAGVVDDRVGSDVEFAGLGKKLRRPLRRPDAPPVSRSLCDGKGRSRMYEREPIGSRAAAGADSGHRARAAALASELAGVELGQIACGRA